MLGTGIKLATMTALLCGVALTAAQAVQVTEIWVDAGTDGSDSGGDGSPDLPYKTINKAKTIAGGSAGSKIIKVLRGTYDKAHEDDFTGSTPPFPIVLPVNTDLIGAETSQANWPRIGGGVNDSNVRALVEVLATAANRTATIEQVIFAGENSSGKDAPSAIYVESSGGWVADVTITNCIVERSEMNDTSVADKPAIHGIGGPSPDSGQTPSLTLLVVGCPAIGATVAGGVVADLGSDADSSVERGYIDLVVTDCNFALDGSEGSAAAIDFVLEGFHGTSTPLFGNGLCSILRNVVDSRTCSGTGSRFTTGLRIGGIAKYGGDIFMSHSQVFVQYNDLRGCSGSEASFVTEVDANSLSVARVESFPFTNNFLRDGLGSGLVMDWGDGVHPTYLRVNPTNCMIVDNHDGIEIRDATVEAGDDGACNVLNCTIAGNSAYGIKVVSTVGTPDPGLLAVMYNSIVYGNGSGSASGWVPADAGTFKYNDYAGLSPGWGCVNLDTSRPNLDVDPAFVNASVGNYHIGSSSCCIDNGTNRPANVPEGEEFWSFDIDGQARKQDGDHPDCEAPAVLKVDIGADEVGDPCEE